ncbi:MAG: membrane dipeptidase [Bacteroidetes bacterium]|nr:membrane dipeptidase [Bacteroidota bacterium]
MPFFDFHLHPALKPQLSDPQQTPSPWDPIHIGFAHPDIVTTILKCSGINDIVDSQASLSQLAEAKLNLVVIALFPPERHMMRDPLIQKIAAQEQSHYIHRERVNAIATGDIYYQMLLEEIAQLQTHSEQGGKKLKIIRSMNEYDENDLNTVHAVLSVEGPHAFDGVRSGKSVEEIRTTFYANFDAFTQVYKLVTMNIAHLEDNDFCNHAFGIQVFKPRPFFPKKNGITQEGFDLVLLMKEKNILVDVKHTSLFGRKQLFGLQLHDHNWPIVCTHAGLTGIPSPARGHYFLSARSVSEGYLRVRHQKPVGYLQGTSFNACSINLYDDDVAEIVRSGGMIGLSLDQRILGLPDEGMMSPDYVGDFFDEEIISPGEKEFFRGVPRTPADSLKVLNRDDIRLEDRQHAPTFHARHFMNQVFHLFQIASNYGIDANQIARHICIGSDFDGLINPLKCCRNVVDLQRFKDLLSANFSIWEEEFIQAGGPSVSAIMPVEMLLDHIFYQNGVDYLRSRLG